VLVLNPRLLFGSSADNALSRNGAVRRLRRSKVTASIAEVVPPSFLPLLLLFLISPLALSSGSSFEARPSKVSMSILPNIAVCQKDQVFRLADTGLSLSDTTAPDLVRDTST